MINIKGYTIVDFTELQKALAQAKVKYNKTYFQISNDIQATSSQTAVNAISTPTPKLSDVMLTKVMAALKVNGFVLTTEGTKYYYIKQ